MTSPVDPVDRLYGGESAAERRLARRRRLTTALLDLVSDRGIESMSVGAICERASVSKRHLYQDFGNLDDLADATLTDVLVRVAADITAAAEAAAAPDAGESHVIGAAVEAVLAAFDDPRVARLYLEAPGNSGLRAARDRAVSQFVTQLLTLEAADRASDPRAQLIAHVVVGGTTEVVALWLRGDLALERHDVVRTLVDLGTDAMNRIRALTA